MRNEPDRSLGQADGETVGAVVLGRELCGRCTELGRMIAELQKRLEMHGREHG